MATKTPEKEKVLSPLRAASSPQGRIEKDNKGQLYFAPAIELSWEVPLIPATQDREAEFADPDSLKLYIRRQESRFPGQSRKGIVPQEADLNIRDLQLNKVPIIWLLLREYNSMAGILFLRESLSDGIEIYNTVTIHVDLDKEIIDDEWQGNTLVKTIRQYQMLGNPPDRVLRRSIRQEYLRKTAYADPIPFRMTVHVWDRESLQAGTTYYYTAYVADESESRYFFSRRTQAAALATGYYGHNLFKALPQVHQQFDTQTPASSDSVALVDRTKGQLQRFLDVFDAHLDLLHGTTEGLRDLHNVQRADSRLLPHLAHLIGWRLKDNLNEQQQRNEIGFAPDVYKTVGTIPLIKAIVNRHTGWTAEVKEFSQNVLLSFDTSRVETTDSGTIYLDRQPVFQGGKLQAHPYPAGSIDTSDPATQFYLKNRPRNDTIAYTFDSRNLTEKSGTQLSNQEKDTTGWYNRRTIGVYLTPDVQGEELVLKKTAKQLGTILKEFLPIQVKVFFVIEPPVIKEDPYPGVKEDYEHQKIQWTLFTTNDLQSRSVNTAEVPLDTRSRTWWADAQFPNP